MTLVFSDLGVEFLHANAEFGDDFRVLFGEVVFLAEVGFEVEEHDVCTIRGLVFLATVLFNEELVFALPKAFEIAARGVINEFVARRFVATGKEVGDVETIDFLVFWKRGFGKGGDGGKEVDGAAELVAGGVGGDAAGSPHDTGDTLATFEGGAFALAKRPR